MLLFTLFLCVSSVFGDRGWSTQNNGMYYNGKETVLKGFSSTCLEYIVRGIGTPCFADYNWDVPNELISSPDMDVIDAIVNYLKPVADDKNSPAVMPFIRVPVTASSYLGDETSASADNMQKYPDIGKQYSSLVSGMVDEFTKEGIVVIIDLHWNSDDNDQQPMASKGGAGDTLKFWRAVANSFKDNELVFFELYNEPYVGDYNAWAYGNGQYTGMMEMMDTIRGAGADNMLVIAGGAGYAYDIDTLIRLNGDSDFQRAKNIVFNFHPYMGEPQAGDPRKSADGFENFVSQIILQTDRPIIVTEFGQACCPPDGSCYQYNGYYNGKSMGYTEAIINVCEKHKISYCWWAWRPQASPSNRDGGCLDCNNGLKLQDWDPSGHSQGANFEQLYNEYMVAGGARPSQKPTTPSPGPSPKPGNCADVWQQCGGDGWSGATCCNGSCSCTVINQWYSQCVPPSGNSCNGDVETPLERLREERHH